jgi:hypothetical protein
MNYIKSKIPSKGWLRFWGITGSISGALFYDNHRTHRILQHYEKLAAEVGSKPVHWAAPNKKLKIYIDPESWGHYWFQKAMKPILDEAGFEVQVIEPDSAAQIAIEVRDFIWKGQEQLKQNQHYESKLQEWESKRGIWTFLFGYGLNEQEREMVMENDRQEMIQKVTPNLYKPVYDPRIGIVAIGPNAWRHVLYGMEIGLTNSADKNNSSTVCLDPGDDFIELETPNLGYVSCQTIRGFARFPVRMANWFMKRYQVERIAKDTIRLIQDNTKPITIEDWGVDQIDLIQSEREGDDEEKKKLSKRAEEKQISNNVLEKLSMYQ